MGKPVLRLIRPGEEAPSPRISDLLSRYELAQRALGRQPRGIQQYVRLLRQFMGWLGPDAAIADMTRAAVLDYRDSFGAREAAGSTVINALAAIRSFAVWASECGLMTDDPTAGVRRPRKAGEDPHPLTPAQVARLLHAIEEPSSGLTRAAQWRWRRNRRVVLLMLLAGLRFEETRLLTWRRIQLGDQMIDVVEGAKFGKPRRVAIHPDLATELQQVPLRQSDHAVAGLPAGDPLSRGGLEHVFDRWLGGELDIDDKLGVHLHPHGLRHTFATHFMRSGGSTLTLQRLLGHADASTLARYVLTDDDQKRDEVVRLRFSRE